MTSSPRAFDVVAVGNALVDVLASVEESFLTEHNLVKASMQLMDAEGAGRIYDALPAATESSGGSAANSMAVLASFGGKAGFIGRIGQDQLGEVFAHDMKATGVTCAFVERDASQPTGRSIIAVTPEGERTMCTSLACNVNFSAKDVDASLIAQSKVVFLEGYLFDQDGAKQAYYHAAKLAREAGCKVALTLSDSFCVTRHLQDFRNLVQNDVDILFANEAEIKTLTGKDSYDEAIAAIRGQCETIIVTHGAKGAWLASGSDEVMVPAVPDVEVVDMTGAGDAYAGGVLFGLAQGYTLAQCGALGAVAAAEAISHFGARPQINLADLLAGLQSSDDAA